MRVPSDYGKAYLFYIMEIWRQIEGHKDYHISNMGRVKSRERKVKNSESTFRVVSEKIKKTFFSKNYATIALSRDLKSKTFYIHRLVALSFLEKKEGQTEINHINGIKHDNRVENLEWCTKGENNKHAFAIGLKKPTRGVLCGMSKLTDEDVLEIRKSNLTRKQLKIKYNVGQTAIHNILNNISWAHI